MKLAASLLMFCCLVACAAAPTQNLRTVSVSIKTPNPCWRIQLIEIYRVDKTLFAVSKLYPPSGDMACAQVIASARDQVTLQLPAFPVRHLVLGQTWNWGQDRGYETVVDRVALKQRLANAELLYRLGEGKTTPAKSVL